MSPWLVKRYGLENYAIFVQLMGIPLRKGKFRAGDTLTLLASGSRPLATLTRQQTG